MKLTRREGAISVAEVWHAKVAMREKIRDAIIAAVGEFEAITRLMPNAITVDILGPDPNRRTQRDVWSVDVRIDVCL